MGGGGEGDYAQIVTLKITIVVRNDSLVNFFGGFAQRCLCIFCNFDFQISFLGNFQYATGLFFSESSHISYFRPRKCCFCDLFTV